MEDQSKTEQELIKEISDLKQRIKELEQPESGCKQAENLLRQEHELYLDLVNNQPAGIYRIRVFPREQWQKDAWINPEHPPYSVDMASNRFCEILGINRQVFETNPGIVEDLIYPEDKEDFTRRNDEANAEMVLFRWEGRLFIRGEILWVHFESIPRLIENGVVLWTGILYDITDRKRAELEREAALARIKKLEGVIPICMHCKMIRDDKNSWNQLEQYITEHSEALFSHGQCPECAEKAIKEFEEFNKEYNK